MKHSKFISVVIATLLLFCSADVFAQRSRASRGSGGRTQGYSRSASNSSYSHSSTNSSSGRSHSQVSVTDCTSGLLHNIGTTVVAKKGVYNGLTKPTAVYCSTNDVLNSSSTNFGFEVSKRKAKKKSILVPRQAGDFYYRDGIFFSKSSGNGRKYEIHRPNSGLHVPVLPAGSKVYEFEGVSYYYYYGTYYVFDNSKYGFVVVTPPVGLVVDLLPCDAKEVMVDDNRYMVTDNVLYKVVSSNNEIKYEVARLDKETMYLIKDYLSSSRIQQMMTDLNYIRRNNMD